MPPVRLGADDRARPGDPAADMDAQPFPWSPSGNKRAVYLCSAGMPLTGDYEPSAASWARGQVSRYGRSGGTEGTDLNGRPVIILTLAGAKTGKLRKTPLMRAEHGGDYAVLTPIDA